MRCLKCGSENLKVIDSRPSTASNAIRRRRECENCGYRFTTFERLEDQPMVVIKKNGDKEPFDRQKVQRGLIAATVKRNVTMDDLERLIDLVLQDFKDQDKQEVSSTELGEAVLNRLRDLDNVAYIRFASVYKQFNTIDEFNEEVRRFSHDNTH